VERVEVRGEPRGERFTARTDVEWLSLRPSSGKLPATITVSVNNSSGLSPGDHRGSLVISSGSVSQTVTVTLAVPAPVVVEKPKPVVTETTTITPPPPPPGLYGGLRRGRRLWAGSLPPNGKLVLTPDGVVQGGGNAYGDPWPGGVKISMESPTPGVKIEAAPSEANGWSTVVLSNTGREPITRIQIDWRRTQ
jgi:hypothetical protein